MADVAGVEEPLKGFGGDDFLKNPALLGWGECGLVAGAFHPVTQPTADGEVHDVHELDTDVVAIGLLEERQDVAERSWAATAERAGIENGIEVVR